MSDSWFDRLPSLERQRIRERFRLSESEYEKLREKVKGPRELAEELERNERMAELKFAMETEPKVRSALKAQVREDIGKHGLEAVVEARALSREAKASIEEGRFSIAIEANKSTNEDQLMVVLEGKVAETVPLAPAFSEQYLAQFQQAI